MIPYDKQLRLTALDQSVRVSLARSGPLGEVDSEDNQTIVDRAEAFHAFLAK